MLHAVAPLQELYLEVCRWFLMFPSLLVDNGDLQITSAASLLLNAALLLPATVCNNSTLTAARPHLYTLKHLFTTPLHLPDSHTSVQALMLPLLTQLHTLPSPPQPQQVPRTPVLLSSPCKAWCLASL